MSADMSVPSCVAGEGPVDNSDAVGGHWQQGPTGQDTSDDSGDDGAGDGDDSVTVTITAGS
jgi:hypothetical protein